MVQHEERQREIRFSSPPETEIPQYRPLSGLAVTGLILGLLSFLTIVHIGLAVIGVAAILVCAAAMIRISRTSGMVGRGLALTGMALAVFWITAAAAKDIAHAHWMNTRSQDFAILWFDFLRANQPEKALELSSHPAGRRPLNDRLMDHFLTDPDEYESFTGFLSSPEVRALLDLGDRAQVRLYQSQSAAEDRVLKVYAVTYEEDGVKKTFFVRLLLRRAVLPDREIADWYVEETRGPILPDALRNSEAS